MLIIRKTNPRIINLNIKKVDLNIISEKSGGCNDKIKSCNKSKNLKPENKKYLNKIGSGFYLITK